MKKFIILITIILSLTIIVGGVLFFYSSKDDFVRFGYIRKNGDAHSWDQYAQLYNGTYTHLALAFLVPQKNGEIQLNDAVSTFSDELIQRVQSAGTKMIVSIGGASVKYSAYKAIAEKPESKEKFIQELLKIVNEKNFDGIDLNFEGWEQEMTDSDRENIELLATDLAQAFKAQYPEKTISITLPTSYWMSMGFSCEFVNSELVDFAHHLSYDYFEKGEDTPNGPFRNPNETITPFNQKQLIEKSVFGSLQYFAQKGCNLKKITGGIPFYTTQGDKWDNVARITNWYAKKLNPFYLEKKYTEGDVSYWVNDHESVYEKVKRYRELELKGVVVREVTHEGVVGDLSRELLK